VFKIKYLFVFIALLSATRANAQSYDLILRNGRIIDGTGSPWYRGDVAIRGDSIAQIAASIPGGAARVNRADAQHDPDAGKCRRSDAMARGKRPVPRCVSFNGRA
jgi:hypothetical protein